MKRSLLLLLALVLFSFFPALAQVKVGVKAGRDWRSEVYKDTPYNTLKQTGSLTFAGIFTTIPVTEKVYIRPEFIVVTWQLHQYINMPDWGFNADFRFPVLVGYRPLKRFSVLTGPELRYSTGRFFGWRGDKRFEAGISGGVNYQFWKNFSLDATYTHGLTDLIETEMYDEFDRRLPDYKGGRSQSIRLSLAYTFGKNKTH